MIVAIEGASASGKTRWCQTHFPSSSVLEPADNPAAPDLFAHPLEVGQFWLNYASESWQRALAVEREHGVAFCDADPLHLYYSWSLWKSGALDGRLFELQTALCRLSLERQHIGFVDLAPWSEVPDDELRRRRPKADVARRRKRHEMHLVLAPWMKRWFAEREHILPGSVSSLIGGGHVDKLPAQTCRLRYDVAVMDEIIRGLEKRP